MNFQSHQYYQHDSPLWVNQEFPEGVQATHSLPNPTTSNYPSSMTDPSPVPHNNSDAVNHQANTTPTSPPHRRSNSSSQAEKRTEEKRKRSRVTPEQLVHLEQFFATDRTPTATKRKEISDLLGMQERQTQIWFQNRRAKAKLQDGKQKDQVQEGAPSLPSKTILELSSAYKLEVEHLVHENDSITLIPCTELAIGTWRRSASPKYDLIAYKCSTRRCLYWYTHLGGRGLKMEVPFETMLGANFESISPESGLVSFVLSRPPVFYAEEVPMFNGVSTRTWQICQDWTDNCQASTILRHDVLGSAIHLSHLLQDYRMGDANKAHIPSNGLFDEYPLSSSMERHLLSRNSPGASGDSKNGRTSPSIIIAEAPHSLFINPNVQAYDLAHHLHIAGSPNGPYGSPSPSTAASALSKLYNPRYMDLSSSQEDLPAHSPSHVQSSHGHLFNHHNPIYIPDARHHTPTNTSIPYYRTGSASQSPPLLTTPFQVNNASSGSENTFGMRPSSDTTDDSRLFTPHNSLSYHEISINHSLPHQYQEILR